MNLENENKPTYEPILQQKLDMMTEVIALWQRTTHEQHVALMRAVIDMERTKAILTDARVARADANAA
jgi:hypothetical protein